MARQPNFCHEDVSGKSSCALYNRERMDIIKLSQSSLGSLINSCSEILRVCHHKPQFHRFHEQETSSADECKKREKVILEASKLTRRKANLIGTDGNEILQISFPSVNGTLQIHFHLISRGDYSSERARANRRETISILVCKQLFRNFKNGKSSSS
jgi:hypothetical protein